MTSQSYVLNQIDREQKSKILSQRIKIADIYSVLSHF